MDKAKAKKAVKKSASRKKATQAQVQNAAEQIAAAYQTAHVPTMAPEVQKGAPADMQPADGLLNPYRPMGAVAPTMYTPGNLLPGYGGPQFVNPKS
mgnify:CR=1 FL=1